MLYIISDPSKNGVKDMIQKNPDYAPYLYRENVDKFLSFAAEIHIEKFLAKYLEDGCYVIDKVTKEEKLPTGPSFNNTVSYIKRHDAVFS